MTHSADADTLVVAIQARGYNITLFKNSSETPLSTLEITVAVSFENHHNSPFRPQLAIINRSFIPIIIINNNQ